MSRQEKLPGTVYMEYEEARLGLNHIYGLADNEQTRAAREELSSLARERRSGDVTRETARVVCLALDMAAQQAHGNKHWWKMKKMADCIRARASS